MEDIDELCDGCYLTIGDLKYESFNILDDHRMWYICEYCMDDSPKTPAVFPAFDCKCCDQKRDEIFNLWKKSKLKKS